MQRIIIIFISGILPLSSAWAQTEISGTVTDKKKQPIEFANVFIEGTSAGATTDSLGRFDFKTNLKGQQILSVSAMGYKSDSKPIQLHAPVSLNIVLQEDVSTLEPVVISAGSFEASDKSKGASLNPIDVVTTAGSNGDIANALRTLPGTQQIGEQEGLFVRGGTNEETKQFMDGTLIKSPNFSSVPGILQPARVSPFLFKGILFSSGGYSALYGQALSGALILESTDLPDKSSGVVGISPVVAVAGFQSFAKNKKSSYGINTRYYNTSLYNSVVTQKPDYFKGPGYFTGDANYRIKTSDTGILKFYSNVSTSAVGLRNPDIDSASLKNSFTVRNINFFNNLSYREFLGDAWQLDAGASYNFSKDDIQNELLNASNEKVVANVYPLNGKNNEVKIRSDFAQGRLVLSRFLKNNWTLRFGGEYFFSDDHYKANDESEKLRDHLTALFSEADIYITPRLAGRAGVRYEYSALLKKSNIAPRLSLAYRMDDEAQLNLAYGRFYQKPENRFLQNASDMEFSASTHYVLNYTRKSNNRLFRIEGYYKDYDKLVKTNPDVTNQGSGYAQGAEFFWRDKRSFKNLDYWITYTYLDTKREFQNYPTALHPTFSTPHTASIAVKRLFDLETYNVSVNTSYTFATGRPYYNIAPGTSGEEGIISDQGTTRPYHGLNLSLGFMTSLFKEWKNKDFTILAIGVNNVLGSKQVFGYSYSADGSTKSPVTLPASRSFFAGLFITFGVDRTDDFQNENL
jgi:vitamin B12 transporter